MSARENSEPTSFDFEFMASDMANLVLALHIVSRELCQQYIEPGTELSRICSAIIGLVDALEVQAVRLNESLHFDLGPSTVTKAKTAA